MDFFRQKLNEFIANKPVLHKMLIGSSLAERVYQWKFRHTQMKSNG